MVEPAHPALSVRRQCELLGLSRPSLYYEPAPETPENLRLMRLIDEQYTARPFYGSRRLTAWLRSQGHGVNRKRVQRLHGILGLEAIHPRPRRRGDGHPHRVFPYLLRDVSIDRPDQVVGQLPPVLPPGAAGQPADVTDGTAARLAPGEAAADPVAGRPYLIRPGRHLLACRSS